MNKEELEYAKTHCLFHSDCPTQKENADLKEEVNKIAFARGNLEEENSKFTLGKKLYFQN